MTNLGTKKEDVTGRELACNLFDNIFKRVVGKVVWIKVDMKKIFLRKYIYKKLTSHEHFAIPPHLQMSSPCLTLGKWSRPLHLRLIHLRGVRVRVGLYLDRR